METQLDMRQAAQRIEVRRRPRWVLPLALGGVVAALLAAVGIAQAVARGPAAARPLSSGAEPQPDYLDWPARGADKDDPVLFQNALDVWDGRYNNPTRERMRPHSDVRLLFGQHYGFGDVVVLQGADQGGDRVLAIVAVVHSRAGEITGSNETTRSLWDVRDPLTQVSTVIDVDRPDHSRDMFVFVLGAPGTTSITVRPAAAETFHEIGADVGAEPMPPGGIAALRTYRGSDLTYDYEVDDGFVSVSPDPPLLNAT